MNRITLTIESDLGDVSLAAVAVNTICRHLGFNESQANEVELCVVEAVTNAIRHAYLGEPGNTVTVAVVREPATLHFDVSDTGKSMSPVHVQHLLQGTSVVAEDQIDRATLREGGRGLQIIHDLMDEVAYGKHDGRNCLRMTKHRVPSTQTS